MRRFDEHGEFTHPKNPGAPASPGRYSNTTVTFECERGEKRSNRSLQVEASAMPPKRNSKSLEIPLLTGRKHG